MVVSRHGKAAGADLPHSIDLYLGRAWVKGNTSWNDSPPYDNEHNDGQEGVFDGVRQYTDG